MVAVNETSKKTSFDDAIKNLTAKSDARLEKIDKEIDEKLKKAISRYDKVIDEAGLDSFKSKYNTTDSSKDKKKNSEEKQLSPEEIWNSIDKEERELVKGKNLLELDSLGRPVYQVAKGSKDGKYHIYKDGRAIKDLDMGDNVLYDFDTKPEKVAGKSKTNWFIKIIQKLFMKDNGDFEIVNGVKVRKEKVKTGGFYLNRGAKTMSPLIVDYNQDGKVSAEAGKGIDLNNDGKADGTATNGDKMIAMSDLNGNGKIDGAEVFGDRTINPFTGKKINAENGFEALKEVALSAQKQTGLKCFDGKNVNLNNLKAALSFIGVNLGFVSDNNNKQLEKLSKINKINVVDYKNTPEKGKVQHNQKGSGKTKDGEEIKVDDVWFKV